MSRPRILFFCPWLGGGGGEKHLAHLIASLNPEAIDKHYVSSTPGGSYETILDAETRMSTLGIVSRSSTRRLLASIMPLARLLRTESPHFVFSLLDPVNFATAIAIARSGISTQHVQLVQTSAKYQRLHVGGLANHFFDSAYPIFYRRRSHVVCLSVGVANEVRARLPALSQSVIHTIPNIAGPREMFVDAAEVGSGSPARDPNLVVCCGRLVEMKGFDIVLRALARLTQASPALRLRFVGDGPDEPRLRALAADLGLRDRVEFVGRVNDPESHFRCAAIFVLSSHYEGFGNVIVEAMASGAAVVATDCPYGPGEIISDGESGILVPPGDPERMADALALLHRDTVLRDRLSMAGWRRARRYLRQNIAGEYCAALGLPPEAVRDDLRVSDSASSTR